MPEVEVDASIPLTREEGIAYGEAAGKPLLLDAAYSAGTPDSPRPAVVYVHGGGWRSGTRQDPWFTPYLATHGFFAVTIDYRLSGEATFPAQIHDVKAAIRWLRANAEMYQIDP